MHFPHEPQKKIHGWLGCIGDYITLFYMDCHIDRYKDPYKPSTFLPLINFKSELRPPLRGETAAEKCYDGSLQMLHFFRWENLSCRWKLATHEPREMAAW